jgi:hypothetical protein
MPAMLPHDVALILHSVAKLQHVTGYAFMEEVEGHVSLRLESYRPQVGTGSPMRVTAQERGHDVIMHLSLS